MYNSIRFILLLFTLAIAQTPTPAPSIIPLAARSPYLLNSLSTQNSYSRTWQAGFSNVPQGWAGLIRVNGSAYAWMGSIDSMPKSPAIMDPVVSSRTLYPTRSVFSLVAGPMQLTVTFLSPIEPSDPVKQSIPASYVALEAHSTDGAEYAIQVYTDITAEWVTGDRNQVVTWVTNIASTGTLAHAVAAAKQTPYNEYGAQSTWGTIYYATQQDTNVTFQTASDLHARGNFTTNGILGNTLNNTFRTINDEYPVFAFAHDLGTIQQTSAPLVWAVANIRDSESTGVADYTDLFNTVQGRSLYYRSQYTDDYALLKDFLEDYPSAFNRSQDLDNRLMNAATALGGPDYADLLAIATRQAYCGIEVTIGRSDDGSVNKSDLMVFYKDTGLPDNGVKNLVSPVEGLLSIFPMILYIDRSLSGALLEPLLRFQDDEAYTNAYAALDMGAIYPRAIASSEPHSRGIEASAAMIIMAYGHAKFTGDHTIIGRYYALLERWGQFLLSQIPSTDSTIQSDIALRGIIAIQAMSNIGALLGNDTSASSFSSRANTMYTQWLKQSIAPDGHMLFDGGSSSAPSFSLGYNMFWDLVLGTGLLDMSVIDPQVNFIAQIIQEFGAPTNSSDTSVVAANWNMLAAAVATRNSTIQKNLISATRRQAWNDASNGQFPLVYEATTGEKVMGQSSPRQGAVYAPLLVNLSSFPSSSSTTASNVRSHSTKAPIGAIVGGTVGGCSILVLLSGLYLLFRRRRSHKTALPGQPSAFRSPGILSSPAHEAITPFLDGMDPSRARSSLTESISQPNRWSTAVENKRALALRRAQQDDPFRVTRASEPTSPSRSSASRATRSEQSNASQTHALLREIANLRREIHAIRAPTDNVSSPPEYDDV